jgi:hypothetical protein
MSAAVPAVAVAVDGLVAVVAVVAMPPAERLRRQPVLQQHQMLLRRRAPDQDTTRQMLTSESNQDTDRNKGTLKHTDSDGPRED